MSTKMFSAEMLHQAVVNRDVETVKRILEECQSWEPTDVHGETVLHLAFKCKSKCISNQKIIMQILEYFLEEGLSVNLKNAAGQTVLFLAVENRLRLVIDYLVQCGANLNVQDQNGNSIIHTLIEDQFKRYPKNASMDLLECLEQDDINFITWLLSKGINVHLRNNEAKSAFNLATQRNLKHILPNLIKHMNDVDNIVEDGSMILESLFETKASINTEYDVQIVENLLVFVDRVDTRGNTLVHKFLKSYEPNPEIIQKLLDRYKNVNAQDEDGNTALHLVIRNSPANDYTTAAVSLLISKGANVNLKNNSGESIVQQAFRVKNTGVLKALLESGADVSPSANPGALLLHEISNVPSIQDQIWAPMVDALVRLGWDVNAVRPSDGFTPLMEACRSRCYAITQKLIDNGANVNCVDKSGTTCVHMILKYSTHTSEMVQRILSLYINVNSQDQDGNTALYLVIRNSYYDGHLHQKHIIDAVRTLLSNGANVNLKNHIGDAPVRLAIRIKRFEVVKVLLEFGADVNPSSHPGASFLHHISSVLSTEDQMWTPMIDTLVRAGWNVNVVRPSDGLTPLMVACRFNCPAIAQKLIENGANVNYVEHLSLMRPIHMAATGGHPNQDTNTETLFKMLAKAGAKINVKNNRGETALYLAANCGYTTVRRLLKLGAHVDVRNNLGRSPLQEAAKRKNVGAIKALLHFGAEINDAGVLRELNNLMVQPVSYEIQILHGLFLNIMAPESKVVDYLTEHWLKLKAANLPVMDGFADFARKNSLQDFYVECLREVETLKTHHLNDRTTLYDLIHMDVHVKYIFMEKKLKELLESPTFKTDFPKYYPLIIAYYNMAAARHPLVKPAKQAWDNLTGIRLPDCVEQILVYLNNEDLSVMATEEEGISPLKRSSKLTLGTPSKKKRLE